MTPETRGRIIAIQQEMALPETTEERKRELTAEAVRLTREARGKVMAGVEAKRPAKRAAKKSGEEMLDELLNGAKDDQV